MTQMKLFDDIETDRDAVIEYKRRSGTLYSPAIARWATRDNVIR